MNTSNKSLNLQELNGRPLRLLLGGFPCFVAGTMILTKNGVKPIEDIRIGDEVWTHNDRYKKVIDIGINEDNVFDIKTQGIYSTVVTKNHPYYTCHVKRHVYKLNNGKQKYKTTRKPIDINWTEVENITKEHFVSSPIITILENPYNLTKEQCWVLGRYVADGHIKHYKRKNRKDSYNYGVVLSISSHKLNYVKNKITTYHYTCHRHTKNVHRVIISDMNLVKFIEDHDFGKGAENKNIPGMILNLPIELAKEFLDGYMSGDGNYNERTDIYSATTISKRLAFSLALLVQKVLKVNTGIYKPDIKPMTIIEGRIVNQKPQYILMFKNDIKKQSHAIIDKNKIWLPFKSKSESLGKHIVYNLSVEDDESYVANNLVVHNCTKFAICQKKDRETQPYEGEGWELFHNYLLAKEKFKPDFFLAENNKSMAEPIKKEITKLLGTDYIMINSSLVSAQNRQRCYWTNIPNIEQPEDRGILLKDVLESGIAWKEKSYTLDANYWKTTGRDFNRQSGRSQSLCVAQRGRYDENGKVKQRYEPRLDGKTNILTTIQKDNMIISPIRIGKIENTAKNQDFDSQPYRVYSPEGKSVTICGQGGGVGAKTGLYATPIKLLSEKEMDYMVRETKDGRNHFDYGYIHSTTKQKSQCLLANMHKGVPYNMICEKIDVDGNFEIDGKFVYRVENKQISYKRNKYHINLPDGYYIIRKLTPTECERLQTMPDGYTSIGVDDGGKEVKISATQRYRQLGNGWTAEVIIHVLSYLNIPKDYPIEVLSMYDGIGTGKYCLDKLGYTNIIYKAYEIDKAAISVAKYNYPDIIECGDAFQLRKDRWEY